MITILEKRILDLEARIPVYLAKIEEQQKKMAEIYSFPNDLAEVRSMCQNLNLITKTNMDKFHAGFSAVNDRTVDIYKKLESLSSMQEEVSRDFTNFANTIGGHAADISNVKKYATELAERNNQLGSRIDDAHKLLGAHDTELAFAKSSITSLNEQQYQLKLGNDASKRTLEAHYSQIENVKCSISDLDSKLTQKIGESVTGLASKMQDIKMPEVKNYDSQIAEMKKDIVTILGLVHSTASQNPDQTKLNEKIKTMENSIAQIYNLLKKYENGL